MHVPVERPISRNLSSSLKLLSVWRISPPMRSSARNYILGLKKRAEIIGSSGVMKIPSIWIRSRSDPTGPSPGSLFTQTVDQRHTKCFHARFQRLKYPPSFPMFYPSSCFAFRAHPLCLPPHLLSIVKTPVALRSLHFRTRSHASFSSCTSSLAFCQHLFLLITYAVDIHPTHYTILILHHPFNAPFPLFGPNFLSLGYLFVGHPRSPAPMD